jgi:hypothetical protein
MQCGHTKSDAMLDGLASFLGGRKVHQHLRKVADSFYNHQPCRDDVHMSMNMQSRSSILTSCTHLLSGFEESAAGLGAFALRKVWISLMNAESCQATMTTAASVDWMCCG